MFSFFDKDDLDDQLEALASLEYHEPVEIKLRFFVLGVPIAFGYFLYDLIFPIVWFVIYFFALWSQSSVFSRIHARSTKGQVGVAVIGQFLISVWYICLPIWLFSMGGIVFETAALTSVFCSILHSVATRARMPLFAASDAIVNILFLAFATFGLAGKVESLNDKIVVVLIMALAIVYYLVALISALRTRRALGMASKNFAETQKMQALGLMTGGIAHDFNNILTVVMGNLDLHREVRTIKEKNQLAADALASADRASTLVAQLLAFSRQANLVPIPIDLGDFVIKFWQMTGRIIPASIQFRTDIPDGLPPVLADPTQFEAALLNLVINARDAMLPSGGELRITCAPLTVRKSHALVNSHGLVQGDYVQIIVSDSGAGIPWHIRKQVFDPFFTTKKIGEGSGLGLSMAKGFVEQSKGALTLESQPDAGTLVTLTLPVAKDTPPVSDTDEAE